MYDDIDEDYYKPIRTGNVFSSNYIEDESNGDEIKNLSIEEYFDGIRPYLNNLIDSYRAQGEGKIHLTMRTNFFLLKILKKFVLSIILAITLLSMTGYERNEILEDVFDSFITKYLQKLEK